MSILKRCCWKGIWLRENMLWVSCCLLLLVWTCQGHQLVTLTFQIHLSGKQNFFQLTLSSFKMPFSLFISLQPICSSSVCLLLSTPACVQKVQNKIKRMQLTCKSFHFDLLIMSFGWSHCNGLAVKRFLCVCLSIVSLLCSKCLWWQAGAFMELRPS